MTTQEALERKIEKLHQLMRRLKMEYSSCEDQLSDLRSDLRTEIERNQKDASIKESGEE